MGITELFSESSIPGISTICNIKSPLRRFCWSIVLVTFFILTALDLFNIITDFFSFPITVSVLVTDSRVLPFPAVTVCNLNPVHRTRFCSSKIEGKPEKVETILCATLDTLLDICKVSRTIEQLLDEGKQICDGSDGFPWSRPRGTGFNRRTTSPPTGGPGRGLRRGKRQIGIRDIFKAFRMLTSGTLFGNGSGGLLGLGESGGFLEGVVIQIAQFANIPINSSAELVPALFIKTFKDVTGCHFGQKSNGTRPLEDALKNLTQEFSKTGCIWQIPKLFELFQKTSQRLIDGFTTCTGPWINSVLSHDDAVNHDHEPDVDESAWYILLELLQAWLADMGRNHPAEIATMGHQKEHLIVSCFFAGKRCDIAKDFVHSFHSSYGNCYSYNTVWKTPKENRTEKKEALSGFTGPKFGLELVLNLETDEYMPTSREAGAKVVIHDRFQRGDPDQDAIHVPPGLATYVGVQMLNITRLAAPYRDKCSDEWIDEGFKEWADAIGYEVYTTQICLKLCLQQFTIENCNCWTLMAPWPPKIERQQCNTRKNKAQADCAERVRMAYYNGSVECNCPPRCHDKIYEKFVSTGRETKTCRALSTDEEEESSADDQQNKAKVIIYYQSLSYSDNTQERKYTWSRLLGAIGGILGVYLGFSFVAILELFDVLIRACFGRSGRQQRRAFVRSVTKGVKRSSHRRH